MLSHRRPLRLHAQGQYQRHRKLPALHHQKLAGLENIGNVKSSFVMKEIKHSYVIEAED